MRGWKPGNTIRIGQLFFTVKSLSPLRLERFGTVYAYSEAFGLERLEIHI